MKKSCPFCGFKPIVSKHAPKINGKHQWQIACENEYCVFNPREHGFESKEQAIEIWNIRIENDLNTRRIMGLSEKKLEDINELLKFIDHQQKENNKNIINLMYPIINRLRLEPEFIPNSDYSDAECVGWELIKKLAKV